MSVVGLDLRGEKELIRALKDLEGSINRRVIKGATRKAMKPLIKAARAKIRPHDRTGQLRKSIGIRQKKFASGIVWTGVWPRRGFFINTEEFGRVDPQFYSHLLEFGNQKFSGSPWMRPAWDANKGAIQSTLVKELKIGIAKEVVKARRKAGGPK